MRLSNFTAPAAIALMTLAVPGIAAAACAKAEAGAAAIRGPNYAGGLATAGCGAYTYVDAAAGNSATATHLDPVGYTHQQATATAFGGDAYGPTASASTARSNLADASLHGTTTSFSNAFGTSYSSWSDTLTFTNATGVNQYFTIGWLVEGDVDWAAGQGANVVANFSIGTGGQEGIQEGYLGYFSRNGETHDVNGGYNPFAWSPGFNQGGAFGASYVAYDLGGDSRLMTGVFGVAPGTHNVFVSGFLDLGSSFGADLDYGATGALRFAALPTGVSFTSESGVFRPGLLVLPGSGTGAVPEPASWALMIGGFGLAGATLRRRRLAQI